MSKWYGSPPSKISPTYPEATGYIHANSPLQTYDKGKTRPLLYPPPATRAPNLYDPVRELEPVQFNVGYVEEGLKNHPPPIDRTLADLLPARTITSFKLPPPGLRPGKTKAPARQPAPRRVNPFDALHEEDALKASSGYVGKGKSDEQLEDAQSCSAESEVFNTWEHYLQDLKPAWNGNRRLAIDVSGDGMDFRRAEDSFWVNEAEVRLVCDLVKGAVDAEVPANGVALTCANFLGVVVHQAPSTLR